MLDKEKLKTIDDFVGALLDYYEVPKNKQKEMSDHYRRFIFKIWGLIKQSPNPDMALMILTIITDSYEQGGPRHEM